MKIYILVVLIMVFSCASAQQGPEVVVYNAPEESKSFGEEINQLKVNLLYPLGGNIAVYMERKVKPKLSLEGSAGITMRNFGQNFLYDFFEIQNNYNHGIGREYGLGPSISGALKYYPDGALEGYYFSPEVRYRRYNSKAWESGVDGEYDEYSMLADFKLMFGYVSYLDEHIVFEYYAGVGLRYRNEEMLKYVEEDPVTKDPVYGVRLDNSKQYVPLLSVGLKFGFSF